jgi:hypothetical protein
MGMGRLVVVLLALLSCLIGPPAHVGGEGGTAMQVTIRIRPEMARALHQRHPPPPTPAAAELFEALAQLGLELAPVHPGAEDPLLVPYFTVDVPDHATAERVIARLQQCQAVEAAYVKPRDEPP